SCTLRSSGVAGGSGGGVSQEESGTPSASHAPDDPYASFRRCQARRRAMSASVTAGHSLSQADSHAAPNAAIQRSRRSARNGSSGQARVGSSHQTATPRERSTASGGASPSTGRSTNGPLKG